ncbi:MAG: hypothetical protein OEZ06_32965 [Myxococcales bacterium]|nr:hypothetical protein [Myxococcales bacterium]
MELEPRELVLDKHYAVKFRNLGLSGYLALLSAYLTCVRSMYAHACLAFDDNHDPVELFIREWRAVLGKREAAARIVQQYEQAVDSAQRQELQKELEELLQDVPLERPQVPPELNILAMFVLQRPTNEESTAMAEITLRLGNLEAITNSLNTKQGAANVEFVDLRSELQTVSIELEKARDLAMKAMQETSKCPKAMIAEEKHVLSRRKAARESLMRSGAKFSETASSPHSHYSIVFPGAGFPPATASYTALAEDVAPLATGLISWLADTAGPNPKNLELSVDVAGYTDEMPCKKKCVKNFGNNRGLARARARRVRTALVTALKEEAQTRLPDTALEVRGTTLGSREDYIRRCYPEPPLPRPDRIKCNASNRRFEIQISAPGLRTTVPPECVPSRNESDPSDPP